MFFSSTSLRPHVFLLDSSSPTTCFSTRPSLSDHMFFFLTLPHRPHVFLLDSSSQTTGFSTWLCLSYHRFFFLPLCAQTVCFSTACLLPWWNGCKSFYVALSKMLMDMSAMHTSPRIFFLFEDGYGRVGMAKIRQQCNTGDCVSIHDEKRARLCNKREQVSTGGWKCSHARQRVVVSRKRVWDLPLPDLLSVFVR